MRIAVVVLAAGFSRRLGRPKQQLVLGGETLVQRAVRVAEEAGFSPVIVVTREDMPIPTDAIVAHNVEAAEGMASSVRCGVREAKARDCDGILLMTCDQIGVGPEHLRALCVEPERVTASFYANRRGVPAYFPASSFAELLTLSGDAGARESLREAAFVEDEGLSLDIDTEDDLSKARAMLG